MLTHKTFNKIPSSMKKAVEAYVPKDLHKFIDFGGDEIKIDSQALQIMFYKSQEHLAPMIFGFQAFPGGFDHFCSDLAEQKQTLPSIFKSLKRKEYIYEQSIVEALNVTLPTSFLLRPEASFIHGVIGFYQHVIQSRMGKNLQLVPYHKELIDKLIVDFHTMKIPRELRKETKESAFQILQDTLPAHKEDPEYTSIWKALNNYEKKSTLKRKPYFQMLLIIDMAIQKFDKFLKNYPKSDNKTPLVRLFENRKNKFVLAHELLESMEKADMDVTGIKERIENMQRLQTIAFNDLGLTGDQLKQIEFVLTPIERTDYRALYIPSFHGNYCILTSDLLSETMKETITVKGIYQCVNEKNYRVALQLFKELEEMVSNASNNCHLIDVVVAEEVKSKFFKRFDDVLGEFRKNVKSVRKVGPRGFTLEDFQNEVRHLGIHQAFPQILILCKTTYESHLKIKPVTKLSTSDMYEILERMQVAVTVNVIPSIFKFLHIHKICRRFSDCCAYCNGTLPLNENMELTPKPEEKKEEAITEAPTSSTSEDVSATSSSSESTSEDVEKKSKKREKKVRQAEKKKLAKEGTQLGAEQVATSTLEPESKVCEKCFRTSQKCMEANEKFRQEKIKNKALKKELKTVSVELEASKQREMEKDEEIRILKEKLAASEEIVQEFQNHDGSEVALVDEVPEVVPVPETSESEPTMMEALIKLLDMKDTMPEHKKEATDLAEELLSKTTQKKYHQLVEAEMIKFRSDYSVYFQLVEDHINWIRKNPNERLDLLRLLPCYPELSKDFHKAYDNVVNKKELDDQECLICMESMEEEHGTVKCNSCRRRYHMSCAWDWSIVKNECAVCKKEIEFPLEE